MSGTKLGGLTAKAVTALKEPGRYCDGNGLYLAVGPGSKSWVARVTVHGRRRELGLGSCGLVTLAEARELARTYRKMAREGRDPAVERKRRSMTFAAAAERVYSGLCPTFKSGRRAIWIDSLRLHVFPHFGERPLDTIAPGDVLAALEPLWTDRHETARRVKQRVAAVFDWAKGAGHFPGENPVNGLKKALPAVRRQRVHFLALPWREVPAFMAELAERDSMSARTLEWIVLTACRSGEARGARWAEIDPTAAIWTVPGERTKTGRPFRVPLAPAALAVLGRVRGLDTDFVFPSVARGPGGAAKVQSDMVFKALFGRMGREGFTTHGFRSCFRDWCAEAALAPRELAEAALAHQVASEVERAYARSDLLDRRRGLMGAWANFCTEGKS